MCKIAENSPQPYEMVLLFSFYSWSFINMGWMNEITTHTVPKNGETESGADKQWHWTWGSPPWPLWATPHFQFPNRNRKNPEGSWKIGSSAGLSKQARCSSVGYIIKDEMFRCPQIFPASWCLKFQSLKHLGLILSEYFFFPLLLLKLQEG